MAKSALEKWKEENRQNKPVTVSAPSAAAAPVTRGPSATSVYGSANRTAPMGMETRNTLMAAATEIAARQAEEQRRKKQQEAFMSNPRASTAYARQTEKAPVQDRARKVAEIRKDIDTTPVQGRVGKGLQSIGLSTPASIEYLGESAKQAYKNQQAYEESDLQQRISEAYSNLNLTERQYGWGSPEYEQARQNYDAVVAQLNAFKNAPDKAVDMDSRAAQFMGRVQKLQEEALEGTSGAGRFLGEAALSIGSNLAKLPANAIIPGASLALMGAEAAAGKAYELGQQGVNAGQALTRGLVSGGIEALTEKIPLDNLVDIIKTGGKTGLMNVLKQAVTEAGEEGVAYLLNLGADKVAGDPEAEFVWNDFIRSMGLGALSGGVMGGGATAINRANAAAVGKNYQDVAPELIEEGLQMNRDTDAYRTAAEMQRKLDAGKTLSDVDVGRVVQDNETAMAPLRQAAMEMAEEQVEREAQDEMPKRTVAQPIAMKPRMAYTETRQNTEGGVNGGEEVHLRESGQRDDRAYPGGEVPRMEESAGRDQSRQDSRLPAKDAGAADLRVGEEVSTASLGIGNGAANDRVRVVTGGDTEATAKARAIAKERGLRLTLFTGGNLTINGEECRAYITGDRAFVRADHSDFDADQLMRHEAGHDQIAKGEIDIEAATENIRKRLGGRNNVQRAAQTYASAFAGADMTVEEAIEEIICDSLGDMNVFSDTAVETAFGEVLESAKAAAGESRVESKTGPPAEGKASRETDYTTNGLDWALKEGAISKKNKADLIRAIDNEIFRGYAIPKTKDGNYIVESSNVMMITNGDRHDPSLEMVIVLDDEYETFMATAKEVIYNEARYGDVHAAARVIEGIYWPGYARFYDAEAYRADGKYERNRKRSLRQRLEDEAAAGEDVSEALAALGVESDGGSVGKASRESWNRTDKQKLASELMAAGFEKTKVEKWINDVNSISALIAGDPNRLDYDSAPGLSSFVSNAEYGGSFDFSTLCKKRRLLTGTFTAIQKALPDTALTADEILEIRRMMAEADLEVSCGLCYVEGSRANMGQFTKEFIRLYKKYNPGKWAPNMAEMNTPDGIEWVRINHPEVYKEYEYFWNHYGKLRNEDKNLFASQQKPKLYQMRTEYKGEILEHFKRDGNVTEKNRKGGLRLQSFSDFETPHLIDTMQIIMDMADVGLAGQAYTKVPNFAWAFGDTGLKINLSLIAKDVDADGKLVFDEKEGMPIADAMALRDRYSENVGTIIVVFTDDQLKAAMADERIDFIIPFHRSQWKKSQYAAMGLPAKTKDYTYQQNEKLIKPTYHEYRGKMVKDKATNYMPNDYWDFSKSGKENAEDYLKMCAENNKRPKFYKLLVNNGDGSYSLQPDGSTDGYWKLLIDFKMYDNDGNGSPQMPVAPEFNMEEANRIMDEYEGGHAQFPVAQGIVDKFLEKKLGKASRETNREDVLKAVEKLLEEYGPIEPGENPFRSIQIPKKTSKTKNVSKTVRTILEAEATPDAMIPDVEALVAEGALSFESYTDEQAIADATAKLVRDGWDDTLRAWQRDNEAGKISKAHTVTGWALYNAAANKGDVKTALDILQDMVLSQRMAAQALQATRVLKQLAPEAQLYGVQRSVEKLQRDIDSRSGYAENAAESQREVGGARREAADKIKKAYSGAKVRGGKVVVDGNQAGEPFVFEYAQKVGEALAKSLTPQKATAQKTFLQQITSQLRRFASEKMQKASHEKAMTATELLRDYIQNQSFYTEAWEAAQNELREQYADDERMAEFINSGIGVDATLNPRNAVFMQALVKAAAESKETRAMIVRQSSLGVTGMANNIAEQLIRETGAEGSMADTIRDAAAAYVNEVLRESDTNQADLVNASIKNAMSDIGVTLSKYIVSDKGQKATVEQAIIDKLIAKYSFGLADATLVADVVRDHFNTMVSAAAHKNLASRFKKRTKNQKSLEQVMQELGNLGAFDIGSVYNEAATEKVFKLGVTLKVNEELAQRFLEAESQDERDAALREIYADLGRQMPSTFIDRWNAWRYLSMLGNARTQVRNVAGNLFFAPVVTAKNLTATAIESVVSRAVKVERTKSIVGGTALTNVFNKDRALIIGGKTTRKLLEAAWADYANVADQIAGGGKYSEFKNANQIIEANRTIFKNKGLEKARTAVSGAMEIGDVWFSQPHYAAALASYCKANDIPAAQIAKGGSAMDKARTYAIKEAQKATYRDINGLSNLFSRRFNEQGDYGWVGKAANTVMEGILPFRKTPANILARGLEYSPLGLLKSLTIDIAKASKAASADKPMLVAQAIDNAAAGLTGTGLAVLGLLLAKLGLIRGAGEKDEKEREFAELQGHQAYSMELPDGKSVTLDWLAPEALPFFIGVNLWEMTDGKKEEIGAEAITAALKALGAPMLELSCLQSLNDVLSAAGSSYGKGAPPVVNMLAAAATSYVTQFLPTIFGQIERSFQKERMTTYSDKNKRWIPADLQYTIGKATAKIPGWDYQQVPYIDAWGRTESTGNFAENAFGNLLNPAYTSQIDTTAMEDELLRLYRSTGESVFPSRAARYFMVNNERKDLTKEEYVQYATLKGRYSYELLTELVESDTYKALTDVEKAKMVEEVFDNANKQAKAAISEYELDEWAAKYAEAEKTYGIKQEVFAEVRMNTRFLESLKDKNGETIANSLSLLKMEAVYNIPGLTDKQRKALFDYLGVGKSVRHYNKSLVKQKLTTMRRNAK